MTTVVASRDWIAADSFASDMRIDKVVVVDGRMVGFCGDDIFEALRLVDWVLGDRSTRPKLKGDVQAIELTTEGRLIWWNQSLRPIPVSDDLFAIGSGAAYAIGAVEAGADPLQAIEIAARWDSATKIPAKIWRRK